MQTPIVDFVKNYAKKRVARFHMPGHKGKKVLFAEQFDITEIDGADNLSAPDGIIKQSEQNSAKLFGAKKTCFSAEGSSLSIKAMLSAFIKNDDKKVIFAGRNAHKAFIHSAILLDFDVKWLYGENSNSYLSANITPEYLQKELQNNEKPTAVYITSPDYLGNMPDIAGLKKVCDEFGVPLLVDNAHGAYLKFLNDDMHPITLGATACCDSAHKTLPVLTGGAYLHFGADAEKFIDLDSVKDDLSLFSSSSPSYLIMASLDNANKILAQDFTVKLNKAVQEIDGVKKYLTSLGVAVAKSEPLKIVIDAKKCGYTGFEVCDLLKSHGVTVEFYDQDFVCLMASPYNGKSDYKKLKSAFSGFVKKPEIKRQEFNLKTERVLSPKQAYFAKKVKVKTADALSKTLADISYSCPPAVPIAVIGERVNDCVVKALNYYGVKEVCVVE